MDSAGEIHHGLHICAKSLMSCCGRDRRNEHIYFIDGIGGGYRLVATVLKKKLDRGWARCAASPSSCPLLRTPRPPPAPGRA